jgi:cellulose synthase/poly-beta-1,6-N-acetylglucosamine synthase-like glycosyltransferase
MAQTTKSRAKVETKISRSTPYVSIVVPLLNEDESLGELYAQILAAMKALAKPFEIIFVDDGSTDKFLKKCMPRILA